MVETTEEYRNRINQLKTSIENEPYIKEMREDIAEGISKTGNRQADIEVRQDKIEDDFVAVQQDARSNTPSGAELAVAAGSYNTLGERLDAEQNEVNAQLAQTGESLSKTNHQVGVISTDYYNPTDVPKYDGSEGEDIETITVDQVYGKWDWLIDQHAPNMQKTVLGKDTSGSFDILKLDITPAYPKAKIILGANIHGHGAGGDPRIVAVALYEFIKDIYTNWRKNPVLEFLRQNVHFVILPIQNPWGFDNGYRENVNGVDLNRNFDNNGIWASYPISAPFSGMYKGTAPFSEKETQYIRNVLLANTDAIAYYDFHAMMNTGANFDWTAITFSQNSECTIINNEVFNALNTMDAVVNLNVGGYAAMPNSFNYAEGILGIPSCNPEFYVYPQNYPHHGKELMDLIVKYYGNLVYKHAQYKINNVKLNPEYTKMSMVCLKPEALPTITSGRSNLTDLMWPIYNRGKYWNDLKKSFSGSSKDRTVRITTSIKIKYIGAADKSGKVWLGIYKNGGQNYAGYSTAMAYLSKQQDEWFLNITTPPIPVFETDSFTLNLYTESFATGEIQVGSSSEVNPEKVDSWLSFESLETTFKDVSR